MNTASLTDGSIVRIDRKGRIFLAKMTGRDERGIAVTPLRRGITYTHATSREVVAAWVARPLKDGKVSTAPITPGDFVEHPGPDGDHLLGSVVRKDGQWLLLEPIVGEDLTKVTTRTVTCHYARRGRTRTSA